jgi:hypothetical protein
MSPKSEIVHNCIVHLITDSSFITVLDLVSQVRDVILMNVYLDLGNPGRSGFWSEGCMGKGMETGRSVYEQPGNKVDRILSRARRVPSK